MDHDEHTGVTDDEFRAAVDALCADQSLCDDRPGCLCIDAKVAAGDIAWTVLTSVQKHRKKV